MCSDHFILGYLALSSYRHLDLYLVTSKPQLRISKQKLLLEGCFFVVVRQDGYYIYEMTIVLSLVVVVVVVVDHLVCNQRNLYSTLF